MAVPAAKDHRSILGSAIRKYRRSARLTLEVLAEKAELHPNFLGRVERGEEYISLAALRRIARALKIRVRDLVDAL
jgi:transcriptional regulator with XRE-family HTH domain